MEKIKIRSMTTFILSSLINIGTGMLFGLFFSIINVVSEGFWKGFSQVFVEIGRFLFYLQEGLTHIRIIDNSTWGVIWQTSLGWILIVLLVAWNMYRLYFYYTLSLDINTICEGDGEESESYITALVLSFISLGAYQIYWTYKLAKRLRANAPRYGFKMLETGREIAILNTLSFGFIGAWELIKNMNKVAKVYNQSGLAEIVGGVQ